MISLKDLVILVADDESEIREIVMENLAYFGAEVAGVANGVEAWAELKNKKFDVVLSDVRMPGGDGRELIKRISSELHAKPLLFLMTGYSDLALPEAQAQGVIEIFSKPFDLARIIQVIADNAKKNETDGLESRRGMA